MSHCSAKHHTSLYMWTAHHVRVIGMSEHLHDLVPEQVKAEEGGKAGTRGLTRSAPEVTVSHPRWQWVTRADSESPEVTVSHPRWQWVTRGDSESPEVTVSHSRWQWVTRADSESLELTLSGLGWQFALNSQNGMKLTTTIEWGLVPFLCSSFEMHSLLHSSLASLDTLLCVLLLISYTSHSSLCQKCLQCMYLTTANTQQSMWVPRCAGYAPWTERPGGNTDGQSGWNGMYESYHICESESFCSNLYSVWTRPIRFDLDKCAHVDTPIDIYAWVQFQWEGTVATQSTPRHGRLYDRGDIDIMATRNWPKPCTLSGHPFYQKTANVRSNWGAACVSERYTYTNGGGFLAWEPLTTSTQRDRRNRTDHRYSTMHRFNAKRASYHLGSTIHRPGQLAWQKVQTLSGLEYILSFDGKQGTWRNSLVDAFLCLTHTQSPFHSQQQE